MACTAAALSDHLLTPSDPTAIMALGMPRPPMAKTYLSFDSLPANELRLLSVPDMPDESNRDGNSSLESSCTGGFLMPKVGATTRRKRLFNDLILKMADQGSTKLDFFTRESESSEETSEVRCAKRVKLEDVDIDCRELNSKGRRTHDRRNSDAGGCA